MLGVGIWGPSGGHALQGGRSGDGGPASDYPLRRPLNGRPGSSATTPEVACPRSGEIRARYIPGWPRRHLERRPAARHPTSRDPWSPPNRSPAAGASAVTMRPNSAALDTGRPSA
jgi:hypothetical protein